MFSRAPQTGRLGLIAALAVFGLLPGLYVEPVAAAQPSKPSFAHDIAPLLAEHCVVCHGSEKQEAGLRLDLRDRALAGGDSGPVLVAGKSAQSELFRRLSSADPDERMPPVDGGKPLSSDEIARVKSWIDAGATWPEELAGKATESKHWAFQPIRRPAVPKLAAADSVRGQVRNPIDAFILARLEREKLRPSPEADRSTLMRRLYLDLLGILPTQAERDDFLSDQQSDAYERLVERLLSSPHFGERWGRHWLDLARYGDSNGYELDIVRPNAWRYRDWVVEAINADMPYDRFLVEQLAGDLLPGAGNRQLAATGFHRMTIKNTESGINQEDYRNREMVDRVNTTGAAILGLTLGCAQCHSHKYDPISQQEYYRFYAFFNNVEEVEIDLPATEAEKADYAEALSAYLDKWLALQARQRIVLGLERRKPDQPERMDSAAAIDNALETARKQLAMQRKLEQLGLDRWVKEATPAEQNMLAPPDGIASALRPKSKAYGFQRKSAERYLNALPVLSAKLEKLVASPAAYAASLDEPDDLRAALLVKADERSADQQRLVADYLALLPAKKDEVHTALRMLVTEERYLPIPQLLALRQNTEHPRPTFVLLRGDFKQHGPQVAPATPAVLPPLAPRGERADRLDLARWLVDPANPLTARVAANHVWSHLFGRGLVATVDDFGVQGERPSHGELLDWLASELMRAAWSRKQLVRTIVLSSTYRQSSAMRPELVDVDPLNTLVARQGRHRVEAEIVRDLFLSASGLLDRTLGGPTVYPAIPDAVRDISYKYQIVWPTSSAPDRYRRGLYVHFRRSNPYPSLMMFDAPEGVLCTAERNRSNTPLQALTTLNDPVFMENAQALGRRVLAQAPADTDARLRWLFATCLVRDPQPGEMKVLRELYQSELAAYRTDARRAAELQASVSADKARPGETAAWVATARAITNLDEFLTRE